MFELSNFYTYCRNKNVTILPFIGAPSAGTTMRDRDLYAVFLDFSQIHSLRELNGVCYHELGHLGTGSLHKVSSPYETVERSEYRANRWSAEHYLPAEDFREAFAAGYTEVWQLEEYFDLPQWDILAALRYWTDSRGIDFTKQEAEKCTSP